MRKSRPLSFGIKTAQRHATHDALLSVWQEADNIPIFEHAWLFEGRYYQLSEAPCDPKPLQKPSPPFVIGGEGEQTLKVIAQHADIWDCSVESPEIYQQKSILLENYCVAIGHDPASIEHSRHISVDPSDLKAAFQETRSFIEVGVTHIIYHVPVPDSQNLLHRLAEEVALPLQAAYK